jgi:hypothetical protein
MQLSKLAEQDAAAHVERAFDRTIMALAVTRERTLLRRLRTNHFKRPVRCFDRIG